MFKRLTAEEERDLAYRIRDHEQAARTAIAGLSEEADVILQRRRKNEQTRAREVRRLSEAVAVCLDNGLMANPTSRSSILNARKHLNEANRLYWELAMSAKRIAMGEARKRVCQFLGYEDLVHEGIIGLLLAAKRFDPDRGIRFSTYASWWVKATQSKALKTEERMIRLPSGVDEQLWRLQRAIKAHNLAGTEYTVAGLASAVGIEIAHVKGLLELDQRIISFEEGDENGLPVSSRLSASGPKTTPDINAITRQELERASVAFYTILDDRERYVLERSYGLNGAPVQTGAEISVDFGLSRERIRQIKKKALKKLREYLASHP